MKTKSKQIKLLKPIQVLKDTGLYRSMNGKYLVIKRYLRN